MKNKLIFSMLVTTLILASCGDKKSQQQQANGPMPFPVQKVVKENAITYQEYSANLQGQQNVEIRPKVNGFIEKIFVDEGQNVRKGQILFKLETNTLSQDANASKAAVNAAQVEVNRLIPLVERKIISNVTLETAKANLAQAKANYNSIASNINFATITSPVDGVIGSIPYKVGSLVGSTTVDPLTTVSDIRNIRAYFTMNEKQLIHFNKTFKGATTAEKIKALPPVELILADNSVYDQKGKIETINGLVNARTGSTEFRAQFPNPQAVLRSGGSGIIRLPIEEKDVILLPQNAVYDMQGKQMVYTVGKDNKVHSKIIETNGTSGLNFIVTSGIEPNEIVVIEGVTKLTDNQEIIPQEAGKNAQTAPAPNAQAKK
ncbi:efflux RND transporter periplasmic adaptor subunit [Flavobacterium inviolabile]|uniref:efflux RND transporter periplasmic adaptor subunit n=1 Tax=Flavobacterium inviolabile TaxID=2748320 RepID=UPI0015AD0F3E|nr:efflux RND transporter periplasmic adaptor subunit [Flavobacterium inviolabile]